MPQLGHSQRLLATAGSVLRQNTFTVQSEALEGAEAGWLLAESELFILAIAAAENLAGLREVEAFAAPELLQRLKSTPSLGAKRWDAYLVLMATLGADEDTDAEQLIDIEYNTRGVRRLVAVAVEPTEDDLRRVLRPFLALPAPDPGGLSDAFAELREQLVINGVDEAEANRAVVAFEQKGHLNDV